VAKIGYVDVRYYPDYKDVVVHNENTTPKPIKMKALCFAVAISLPSQYSIPSPAFITGNHQ